MATTRNISNVITMMQNLKYKHSDIPVNHVNEKNNDGVTALYLAACFNHLDLVELLIEEKADVNTMSKDGVSALFMAAEKGNLQIVKHLVAHGADINCKHNNYWTPVLVAAEFHHIEIAKYLIQKGARYKESDGRMKAILPYIKNKPQKIYINLDKSPIEYKELNVFKEALKDILPTVPKVQRGMFAGQLPSDLREVNYVIQKIENRVIKQKVDLHQGLSEIINILTKSGNYPTLLKVAHQCKAKNDDYHVYYPKEGTSMNISGCSLQ